MLYFLSMGKILSALFFTTVVSMPLFAQDFVEPEEEAPQSIIQFTAGDAEVDFFLTGSWTLSLFFATGIVFYPDGSMDILDYFPNQTQGFYFYQLPDLTLSTWLMGKYFIDLTYRGDTEENTILAGYEGSEDEFVRRVSIGNTDISIPPVPLLSIPDTGGASIGAMAELATPSSSHNILLRYDYSEEAVKVFKGNHEVIEERYSPHQYMKGRFFRLPDKDARNVVVYIEDPQGNVTDAQGRKYGPAASW